MALFTLFIDTKPIQTQLKRNLNGVMCVIMIDAQTKETFKSECEPTVHPVENGLSPITDHIILKPNMLTIEGIVTETPLTLGASLAGLASSVSAQIGQAIGGAIPGVSKLGLGSAATSAAAVAGSYAGKSLAGLIDKRDSNGQAVSGFDRITSTIKELQATRDQRYPITIVTGLGSYPNYILKSFTVDRDQKSGRSIKVSLELQQIRMVSSQTSSAIPSTKQGVANKSHGNQKATPATADQTQKMTTAYSGLNWLGIVK